MNYTIGGIQQIGIGVSDVHAAWKWYRQHFNMDVPIFEEAATAELMLPYTDNKPQSRHAVLALNRVGGAGMEIWQYTNRTPVGPDFEIQAGDLGLYACRIKCEDVAKAEESLRAKGVKILSNTQKDPGGKPVLWVEDPYGNPFQLHSSDDWFRPKTENIGGPSGCVIGVSDIDKSQAFYAKLLDYDQVIYDETGTFGDLAGMPSGNGRFRRMLITHSKPMRGPFAPMLGHTSLELIQALDREPQKIFEGRLWGDLGYIHLCYDIQNMDALRDYCAEIGHPFTVDSATALGKSFDMGEAAGLFSYIEDPDGTLLEFVETHKVPIAKKWNFYLNLKKRKDASKPLPRWMLKAMALNRVKD